METTITIDELRANFKSLSFEDKDKVLRLLTAINVDLSERNNNLTGTGVSGFILDNKFYEAKSHKEVFLKMTEIILKKYSNEQNKIFLIKGRKKIYFSKNVADFRHNYDLISGTNIYADVNENSAQLNRRCQRILQIYEINPSFLMIIPDY